MVEFTRYSLRYSVEKWKNYSHTFLTKLSWKQRSYYNFILFQVLLLMPYHKTTVLQMMNDHLESGFSQDQVIKIFCDICKAVSRLHHCQTPIIHRDLKVYKEEITWKWFLWQNLTMKLIFEWGFYGDLIRLKWDLKWT